MVNLWANTSATLTKVGLTYSKDHATVLHSIRKVNDALDGYNDDVLDLIKSIRSRNTVTHQEPDFSLNEMIALINLERRIYNVAVWKKK